MTLTPDEERDIEIIGQVTVNAIEALKRIHQIAMSAEPGSINQIRSIARTTILDVAGRMGEID